MIVALIILAWLGLAFGSFVNALTWRIHKKKDWVRGRSQCPRCGHQLAAKDLVPLFSWLVLKGRCRYCHKPISWQYPAVEVATALIFAGSYHFWPGGVYSTGDWLLFITWLASSVGLMALLVYDARWMLLPNKIVYPTLAIAASGRLIYLIGFAPHKLHDLAHWLLSLLVASGIFWLLFIISRGQWIGFGDVRLGFITGTVLASPAKSFLMILLGSILGTIFVIPSLITGKLKTSAKLPYGPFLIIATFVALLFGGDILDWYRRIFLP